MNKTWSIALAVSAVLLAIVVGFLSFGRQPAPSSTVIPAGPSATETKDGSETTPGY
jgi:hypothetical protein